MSNVISSNADLKLDQNTKEAISRLLVCAAHSIDNNLLENWPLCFKDNATYKILTRADFDLGRKVGVWFCDSKAMLVDRVNSIRSVNVFEPHVYRHILGTSEVTQYKDKKYSAQTNYVVIRTMYDGDMAVFSTGRYVDEIMIENETALFQSRTVIPDSIRYDTMVALPL